MVEHVTRRLFLAKLTKGAVGVAAVGFVAACTSDTTASTTLAVTTTAVGTTSPPDTTAPATAPDTTATASSTSEPATTEAFVVQPVRLGSVSAFVLVRSGEAVIVDTGNPGSEGQIESALEALSVGWPDVGHVILTHLHPDHIGSVGPVMDAAAAAAGYAGAADIAGIGAPRELTPVGDGDQVLDLTIIETPGHTAGSISVLDAAGGSLIVGDAMVGGPAGTAAGPSPRFTSDMGTAEDSVRKLAGLNFDSVYFGHGDPVSPGGKAAVEAVVAGL